MLVCIRDLGQIYGSIEAQHQKTILVDFIDHLADYDRLGRADMLFAKDKVIGAPLISLAAVQDLPEEVKARLFFVRFEDLAANPVACMERVHKWIGVKPMAIDPNSLAVGVSESDSHYRSKYPHRQSDKIVAPARHILPPRTQTLIEQAYGWFYKAYYPDGVKR
jgi:sulfotransferase